jgi:hypothetical protein
MIERTVWKNKRIFCKIVQISSLRINTIKEVLIMLECNKQAYNKSTNLSIPIRITINAYELIFGNTKPEKVDIDFIFEYYITNKLIACITKVTYA